MQVFVDDQLVRITITPAEMIEAIWEMEKPQKANSIIEAKRKKINEPRKNISGVKVVPEFSMRYLGVMSSLIKHSIIIMRWNFWVLTRTILPYKSFEMTSKISINYDPALDYKEGEIKKSVFA